MNTIRTEAEGTNDLNHVSQWLSRHRGQTVELDRTKQLEFVVPISAACAVLVAVTLQADGAPAPQLGGVVRAISNRTEGEPVRLVFEGRSPAHLSREEALSVATELLGAISELVGDDDLVAEVA